MGVPWQPDEYNTIMPQLTVTDAAGLIDYVKQAFDAHEIERYDEPDGSISHAVVRVGDSILMIGEAGVADPTPAALVLYVEDTDDTYERALDAGAQSIRAPRDEFYGSRSAGVRDPFGNTWWIATQIEELTPEEVRARAAALAER